MKLIFPQKFLQLLAVFTLGFLIGGAAVTSKLGDNVDNLIIKNRELTQRLESTEEELEEVKKNLADQSRQVIIGTKVYVSLSEKEMSHFSEESLKLSLEEKIKQLVKPVIGQDIKDLNYSLLPQLLEGRIVTVENTSFELHVKTLVVTDNLIVYTLASPLKISE